MKMLSLSLKELRLIAKTRNINGYESMPKDELLKIINNNNNDNNNKKETERAFLNQKKNKPKSSL